jgi:ribosomal protein S1
MSTAIQLARFTEGYDGTNTGNGTKWQEVYFAYQNRRVLQADVRGAYLASYGDTTMPCLQVQLGTVIGRIPAYETGLNGVPTTAREIAKLSGKSLRELTNRLKNLVGRKIWILITTVNKQNEDFVASRRLGREIMAKVTWKKIAVGATMPATVSELGYKSAVLDLGGVEATMRAPEMSYGFTEAAADVLEIGETFLVKILHADQETGAVEVSRKQALPSPWRDCASRYVKDGVYWGTVSGIIDSGVFVTLEPGINVFTYHPKYGQVYKGQKVTVKILSIDTDRRRIFGSIRNDQRGNNTAGMTRHGGYSAR